MRHNTGFVGPFTGAINVYGYGKTPLAITGSEQASDTKKWMEDHKFHLIGGGLLAAGVIGLLIASR